MAATNLPNFLTPANDAPEVGRFLEYKRVECGLSPRTLEAYGRDLSHFCSWLNPRSPATADVQNIRGYLAACWSVKPNPSTVARRIAVLREFFKQLLRDGLIERDPMRRIEAVAQWKRVHKAISETEVRQLLDAFGQPQSPVALRDRAMLETLYAGAVRVDELVSAKLADLNLEHRFLSVTGKGSKQRLVPLGAPAAYALSSYLAKGRQQLLDGDRKASPFLFVGCKGGAQLTRQRVWQIVKRLGRQFNLPALSPHVLRHSCATHLLDHGADLRTIQIILGHAEISTSQLYTKVSKEHLRETMNRHPRNNPKRLQSRLFDDSVSDILPGPSPCTFPALAPNPLPCIHCASPAVEGKSCCERHLIKAREANRRSRERAKQRRTTTGQCLQCAELAVPGQTLCEFHRQKTGEATWRWMQRAKLQRSDQERDSYGNQLCNLATPAIAGHEPIPTSSTNENNTATGVRFGDRTSSDDRHSTPSRTGAPSHAGGFGADRGKPPKSVRSNARKQRAATITEGV